MERGKEKVRREASQVRVSGKEKWETGNKRERQREVRDLQGESNTERSKGLVAREKRLCLCVCVCVCV